MSADTTPAAGARGLPCLYSWRTPGWKIGPWDIGSQNVCFDGLVGAAAWAAGLTALFLALWLAAGKPGARTATTVTEDAAIEVAGGGPADPAADAAVMANTTRRAAQGQARRSQRAQARAGEPRQAPTPRGGTPQRRRSGSELPVQEQETYRTLRGLGYTPELARRGARAGGAQGSSQERVRRALQSLG